MPYIICGLPYYELMKLIAQDLMVSGTVHGWTFAFIVYNRLTGLLIPITIEYQDEYIRGSLLSLFKYKFFL